MRGRVNMTRPILGFLQDIAARPGYGNRLPGAEEKRRAMVEKIAPGYLLLEGEGKGEGYDHSQFKKI
jgi:hypothetical protein